MVGRRPQPDPDRLERIRRRHAESADAVFAEGYEFGMELAEHLTADQLIRLKEYEFVLADYGLKENQEPWKHSLPGIGTVVQERARDAWGAEWPNRLTAGSLLAHGAVAALRDVWAHLYAPNLRQ